MNRFAEIIYGRVNYIFETLLEKEDLSKVFSPATFWVDVTGTDVQVGWWYNGQSFEPPQEKELTFEKLQEKKKEKMKIARDKAEAAPLEFKNTLLDFDSRSRERLMFAIVAKEKTFWTDYYNEVIELTIEDLDQLPIIIKARTSNVHAKYNKLKSLIESSKTEEELEKIVWDM